MEVMTVGEYVSGGNDRLNWNGDQAVLVDSGYMWSRRGGYVHNGSGSGVWTTTRDHGFGYPTYGFRAVQSGV